MKSLYYVGMDVHKDSIRIAVLKDMEKETVYEATVGNDIPKIVKILCGFKQKGTVISGYEAGCMGYTLQRSLTKAKVECRVIPPNKIFKTKTDKIKTDKRDAILIARMLKNNEGDSIYIPTADDEAARDLLRCRDDIKSEMQRTKQQLLKFLLRSGFIYDKEKSPWTIPHRKWMKEIKFSHDLQKEVFEQYYSQLQEQENRLARIETKLITVAETEPYREGVARLRCFKGIDYVTALAFVCEIGEIGRASCRERV